MPRFTVHASGFPFGIPQKRLGTVVADTGHNARKAAEELYRTTHLVVQLEGSEIETRQGVSPPPAPRANRQNRVGNFFRAIRHR